jgi:hypothetical protein
MTVAQTILAQLGGNMFAMMTGAKGFVAGPDHLFFAVGRNAHGVNRVRVTLAADDTYTVEFYKMYKLELKPTVPAVTGVYADNLRQVFKQYTGLDTSLRG